MKIEIVNGMRVQTPDEGKVLTNGESTSTQVYLGEGATPWAEVDATLELEALEAEYKLLYEELYGSD